MQAIIMAGGEGTRLRPLTCNMPKPLAPLCGKPVLEYILDLLKLNGFKSATLTLLYQGDKIVANFDNSSYKKMELEYVFEENPLGTAGCVKFASHDTDVLVISGDAMCDFELKKAIEAHKHSGADATIITKQVSDPREFGLVLCDKNNRITGFLEKPSYESCTTDLANTGVYILSKSALDLISSGKKSDFAQDIFPEMLKRGMLLNNYEEKGYWCDIGDFKHYSKCQIDMLEGRVKCQIDGLRGLDGIISLSSSHFRGVKITPPCYIGKNVTIGAGSIVDSGSIIGDDVTIGINSKIHASVILNGAFLGERVSCNEAIICENAKLLRGASSYEGSVIGENAIIGENSTVEAGVRIWQGKQLEKNTSASYDVKYSYAKTLTLDDEGICGETNGEITPQIVATLGSSVASSCEKKNAIAVGYKGESAGKALTFAFISGAIAAGADVWDFGDCVEPELAYCMGLAGIELGCYIDAGVTARLRVVSENGLPPTRKQDRKIEGGLNRSEYNKASYSDFGEHKSSSTLKILYENELLKLVPTQLKGVRLEIKTSSTRITKMLEKILLPKSDHNGERIVIHLSSDGKKCSAYTEETGYVFYEKMVLLASKILFENGENIAIPYCFPTIVDELAKAYGKQALRYYNCSCDSSDSEARKIASNSRFARDGIYLSIMVISYLSKKGLTLKKAIAELPEFYSTSKFVSIDKSPSQLLKELCSETGGLSEGVALKNKDGRVLIRPVKTGKGVMLFVDSFKSEMATELCDKFEKLLKSKE